MAARTAEKTVPAFARPSKGTRPAEPSVWLDEEGFAVVRIPLPPGEPWTALDPARTREALILARRLADVWAEARDPHPAAEERMAVLRATLNENLVPRLAELDPVPHATIEQAKRRARLFTNLLASGAYTLASLADGRGQSPAAVRQWVHRARQRSAIFTVKHDGETLVPAFLLDQDLEPRPEYTGAIEALTAMGSHDWALWAWFALPSGWLDGRIPAEHALADPDDVTRAAQDRASNAL